MTDFLNSFLPIYLVIGICIMGATVVTLLIFTPFVILSLDVSDCRDMWQIMLQGAALTSVGWPLFPLFLLWGLYRLIMG